MLLPLFNAFDPYALSLRARRDKAKEAPDEPLVIGSALEKHDQRNASDARPDRDAPEDKTLSIFEDVLAILSALDAVDEDGEEAMPEDAIDGLGLCALLSG